MTSNSFKSEVNKKIEASDFEEGRMNNKSLEKVRTDL